MNTKISNVTFIPLLVRLFLNLIILFYCYYVSLYCLSRPSKHMFTCFGVCLLNHKANNALHFCTYIHLRQHVKA
jgi:hypothetical protein